MPILVNGQKVKVTKFPGGEVNVCVDEDSAYERYSGKAVDIKAYLHSSDDIMTLLMTVDAVNRALPFGVIYLEIPYFPYARQDRVYNSGEALSVKVMAGIINGIGAKTVCVWDPHSCVTPALINNYSDDVAAIRYMVPRILEHVNLDGFVVVSPDAGAEKKTRSIIKDLTNEGCHVGSVFCTKYRSPDGEIVGVNIPSTNINGCPKILHNGEKFIIFDDICDGGATFTTIASDFKRRGAEQVLLYVTHGIFSKGLEVLKEHIDHVYCMHTFLKPEDRDNEFLTILGADDAY